jgi:hypothetical protein
MAGSDVHVRRASACASPAAASSGAEAPAELRRLTRSSAATARRARCGAACAARLRGADALFLGSARAHAPVADGDAAQLARRSHTVEVPHVRQSFNWCAGCASRAALLFRQPVWLTAQRGRDCGLACVLMTLGGLGARRCDLRVMRRLCPTTSIWTVDLAHLLRRFGVDVTFCTITLGANPDFASEVRARPSAWRACQRLTTPLAVILRGHNGGGRAQS